MVGLKKQAVAILLAAGEGSRLGGDKLFTEIDGRPMIERTLRCYRKAETVEDIVIVIPPGSAARFAHLKSPTQHLVENPDPSRGMISSIRAGLESGWTHERHFLIAPADMPFVPSEIVDRLVRTFSVRRCKVALPAYKGLGGHPGVFHRDLRKDFFLLGDTSGTREILFRYKQETFRLNVPEPDICFDVDTPEHLEMAADPGRRWACVELRADARREGQLGV